MSEKTHEITCIVCPLGCRISVTTSGKTVKCVEGHTCKQGLMYARSEALNPCRMLTTSIFVDNGEWPLVSIKTTKTVPKKQVFSVLEQIKETRVKAPVTCGQILLKNVCNTGIDVVATKTVKKKP